MLVLYLPVINAAWQVGRGTGTAIGWASKGVCMPPAAGAGTASARGGVGMRCWLGTRIHARRHVPDGAGAQIPPNHRCPIRTHRMLQWRHPDDVVPYEANQAANEAAASAAIRSGKIRSGSEKLGQALAGASAAAHCLWGLGLWEGGGGCPFPPPSAACSARALPGTRDPTRGRHVREAHVGMLPDDISHPPKASPPPNPQMRGRAWRS